MTNTIKPQLLIVVLLMGVMGIALVDPLVTASKYGTRIDAPAPLSPPTPSPTPVEKIGFSTCRVDCNSFNELFLMNPDGSGQVNLSRTGFEVELEPAISSDGSKIAFSDGNEIWVMDSDGSNRVNLTNSPDTIDRSPSFSPDGSQIVFHSGTHVVGSSDVWLVAVNGFSSPSNLTDDPLVDDLEPVFSPNGNKIAFVKRSNDGTDDIWVMDSDGTAPINLTRTDFAETSPAYSPDGSRITYSSLGATDSVNWDIWVMNADGSGSPTNLSDHHELDGDPVFSPDGSKIAFVSLRDGNYEIYSMNSNDGSSQTNLSGNPANDIAPSWRFLQFPNLDSDSDGILDALDNCPTTPNPAQIDSDNDGQGDACDAPTDTDGDGVPDVQDNCTTTPNPNQENNDGDAEGDVCDLDDDNDGDLDGADNCQFAPNPTQLDTDGDTQGNACDPDDDSDTVTDALDNCPLNQNLDQADADSDGVGDACDACAATPNLQKIAFVSGRDGDSDIFLMNPDGSNQDNLTDSPAEFDIEPSLSLNGKIAFQSNPGGIEGFYLMNADGSGVTNVFTTPLTVFNPPAISPDGNRIAFTVNVGGSNQEIFVINADGSGLTNLTDHPGSDTFPAFSYDGSRIVFTSSRDGNQEIYVMNAEDGSNQTRLTDNPGLDTSPAFSPDAHKIVFMSDRVSGGGIYIMNAVNGANPTRIVNNPPFSSHGSPKFSLDGRKIVFTTFGPAGGIFLIDLSDPSNQIPLSNHPLGDGFPSWGRTGCAPLLPVAHNDAFVTNEDAPLNVVAPGVLSNDTNASTATVVFGPAHAASFTPNGDGSFSYIPAPNFFGTDFFTYRASDGTSDSNIATVSITVNAVNDDPDAVDDRTTVAEDSGANLINVLTNDQIAPDAGETLTVAGVRQGLNGTVAITSGGTGVSYTPNPNFNGTDTFTYAISDGNGGSAEATVDVIVNAVNDNPDAVDDEAEVLEDGGAISVDVLADDVSAPDVGETLIVSSVTQGGNGTVVIAVDGLSVRYTPNPNFHGTDSFTYTILDGNGGSDTATVYIFITPVNDPPGISGGTITRDQGASAVSVIANLSDVDNDLGSLTVTTTSLPAGISVTGITNTSGTITATVAVGCIFAGNYSVGLHVSDGDLTATANLVVSVTTGPDTDGDGKSNACDSCPLLRNPEKIVFVADVSTNPEIYVMDPNGTNPTRLTNNSINDLEPSLSPDLSKIVFVSNRDGNNEIYVMNADGTNPTRLTNNHIANDLQPAFSSDGSKIVFASDRDFGNQIFVMNTDGSNQTRLTTSGGVSPAFSPDGSKIVFLSGSDIHVMNSDGSNPRRLTQIFGPKNSPTFSPDGSKILFSGGGNEEIYLMNADGTDGMNPINLTNNPSRDLSPTFSPDGSKIVFHSYRGGAIFKIYVMNANGSNPQGVTDRFGHEASDPSWGGQLDDDCDSVGDFRDSCPTTFNPEKIAFVSNRHGPANREIYVMEASGANQTRLLSTPNYVNAYDPTFSSRGSKITFTSEHEGNPEIYVRNADGNVFRLTNHSDSDSSATFSPDNSKIAFNSRRFGSLEQIYLMNADGSSPTPLTSVSSNYSPAYSPDGLRIAFVSERDGNPEIYVMDVDGSDQTRLTDTAANEASPRFSPDGSKITFQSSRDGNPEIYLMDADGLDETRLTDHSANDSSPVFSPDGSKIAFTSNRTDNNFDVYVMNAYGGIPTRLTNHPANDFVSSWGRQLDSDGDGIGDICDEPVANTDVFFVDEDTSRNVPAPGVITNDTGLDVNSLTVTLVSGPTHDPSFTLNPDGSFIYTPAPNFFGADSFTYKVSDGVSDSNIAVVLINVTPVNDNPDAVNDTATVTEDIGLQINILANDEIAPDVGETLTVSSVTQGANGVVTITNGGANVSYTPNPDFNGTDSFTYSALDSNGGSDTATVNITVTPVNDAPTVTVKADNLCSGDNTGRVNLLLSDVDSPVANLTLSAVSSNRQLVPDRNIFVSGAGANRTISISVVTSRTGSANISVTGSDGQASGTTIIALQAGDQGAADILTGTVDTDLLFGRTGDDTLRGREGNDLLCGGGGNDTMTGGAGDDSFDGGQGIDTIRGGAGNDQVNGGDGVDDIEGGDGDDTLTGGNGIDEIEGGDGNDVIDGGQGGDTIRGGAGNDQVNGGDGTDDIEGDDGDDTLNGGQGGDTIRGGAGNDQVNGGDGTDNLFGGAGNDWLQGGSGNDAMTGGAGADRFDGGQGNNDTAIDFTPFEGDTRINVP